jgi:cell shape-determining protein MreD
MGTLIAIPILGGLLILQTAVLNQIPLLQGTADLVLLALVAWGLQKRVSTAWAWGIIGALFVGYVSTVPIGVYLVGYLVSVGIAIFLRQRIWNVPLMAMIIATFLSTLVVQGLTLLTLRLTDTLLTVGTSINQIILPSLLINMILALPFFIVFGDLANLLYPETLEM